MRSICVGIVCVGILCVGILCVDILCVFYPGHENTGDIVRSVTAIRNDTRQSVNRGYLLLFQTAIVLIQPELAILAFTTNIHCWITTRGFV
jgi:hypothetical protein